MQWDPREGSIYIWQEEKKVVLEFTLEGEATCYQAFQEEETHVQGPTDNEKHIMCGGLIPILYCWNGKCEESVGNKTEGVV